MHDDAAEMTKALRDLLKQALEHQREIDARQVKINAKLDALLERTSAALIAHDAQSRPGVEGGGGRRFAASRLNVDRQARRPDAHLGVLGAHHRAGRALDRPGDSLTSRPNPVTVLPAGLAAPWA